MEYNKLVFGIVIHGHLEVLSDELDDLTGHGSLLGNALRLQVRSRATIQNVIDEIANRLFVPFLKLGHVVVQAGLIQHTDVHILAGVIVIEGLDLYADALVW